MGRSGRKNSALKKPALSVPSSGRPCCEVAAMTSGNSSSTPRFTVAFPSSRLIVPGMLARTQRLPSSSVGRNSAPSMESRATAPAKSAAAAPMQRGRARMASA